MDLQTEWTESNRREFLAFVGKGAAAASIAQATVGLSEDALAAKGKVGFKPLAPTSKDDFVVADGIDSYPIMTWGDKLNSKETFGFNNDYIAFMPVLPSKDAALLWVNHESPHPVFVSGATSAKKTKAQVIAEQKSVGGSILEIKRSKDGKWAFVPGSKYNRRLDATTKIPFAKNVSVRGRSYAVGTMGNCAGGITPWGTVLTCEENYDAYYGESEYDKNGKRTMARKGELGWEQHFNEPPEHYGWVVEVEPKTGKAKKLTALGRFAHEGACVVKAKDGRLVVYMGDDKRDECFYKFVSDKPGSLDDGSLYVADTTSGKWLLLDRDKVPALGKVFKTQEELLIRTREAARIVGGTPLPRPEGVAAHPNRETDIYIACTNNKKKGNYFGYIAKLEEKGGDSKAMEFAWSSFAAGGPKNLMACPDNIVFDKRGNLWVTTDISGGSVGKAPYEGFGNNALFCIPTTGKNAGKPIRMASAPNEAELTGPIFTPDGKTLFISVQHPGEKTRSLDKLTSAWSPKKDGTPRPAVLALRGKILETI